MLEAAVALAGAREAFNPAAGSSRPTSPGAVGLIAYLWPPLIALFPATLAGQRRAEAGPLVGHASAAADFGFNTWRPRYMPLLRSM
jgi:hypothetical protein